MLFNNMILMSSEEKVAAVTRPENVQKRGESRPRARKYRFQVNLVRHTQKKEQTNKVTS